MTPGSTAPRSTRSATGTSARSCTRRLRSRTTRPRLPAHAGRGLVGPGRARRQSSETVRGRPAASRRARPRWPQRWTTWSGGPSTPWPRPAPPSATRPPSPSAATRPRRERRVSALRRGGAALRRRAAPPLGAGVRRPDQPGGARPSRPPRSPPRPSGPLPSTSWSMSSRTSTQHSSRSSTSSRGHTDACSWSATTTSSSTDGVSPRWRTSSPFPTHAGRAVTARPSS